jgi:hypothetical protein
VQCRYGLLQFRLKPLQAVLASKCNFFSQMWEDVPKGSGLCLLTRTYTYTQTQTLHAHTHTLSLSHTHTHTHTDSVHLSERAYLSSGECSLTVYLTQKHVCALSLCLLACVLRTHTHTHTVADQLPKLKNGEDGVPSIMIVPLPVETVSAGVDQVG